MNDGNPNRVSPTEAEASESPSDEVLQERARDVMARIKLFGSFVGIFAVFVIGFFGYCAYCTFGILGLVIVAVIVAVVAWLLIKLLGIF
jgi:hypothetical protein